MQPNNVFFAFFVETLQRLRTRSPLFFQVWQWIGLAGTLIVGLPTYLTLAGVDIPDAADVLINKVIAFISPVIAFMAALTTDRKPPLEGATTKSGKRQTKQIKNEAKLLPFTVKKEKEAQKKQANSPYSGH